MIRKAGKVTCRIQYSAYLDTPVHELLLALGKTGGSLGCAPGGDAGGREFETPTGPTLRVLK